MTTAVHALIDAFERLMGNDDSQKAAIEAMRFAVTADEARLSVLEQQVAEMKAAPPAPSPDLSALTARLDAIEARLAEDDTAAAVLTPVGSGGPLMVGPATLPAPVLGQAYSAMAEASGGVAPYSLSIASGAFPPDLTMAAGGAITGTATAAGHFEVAIQAHDANGAVASQSYVWDVAAPVVEPPADPVPAVDPAPVDPSAEAPPAV